ncbi:MAG: serine protein kinase RIO [Candidatus Methanomethyliaceae archaeon]|nr:serine protein kinase RIO [Candidatus Methanomethyliaceae archaeon]
MWKEDIEKKLKPKKIEKDEDLFETVEEVFDYITVMALYSIINKGIIGEMRGVVKSGKESRIYWAKGNNDEDLAVKIYLTSSMEFKKGILQYIHGDPRFKVGKNYRKIIYTWAQKEFKNLIEAHSVGVSVPKPIHVFKNILVMEFIGSNGVSAPLLKDWPFLSEKLLNQILNEVKKLYNNAKLVHADLSEYNIMVHEGKVYLIDFGQAVPLTHPRNYEFLIRDINNILRFFRKAGIETPEDEVIVNWLKN